MNPIFLPLACERCAMSYAPVKSFGGPMPGVPEDRRCIRVTSSLAPCGGEILPLVVLQQRAAEEWMKQRALLAEGENS